MPYYPDIHTLFIHIPKTGGTTVETYMKTKSTQQLYGKKESRRILPGKVGKISLQHQTYRTIDKYRTILNVSKNCKMISIVRDPYDRIISDLFFKHIIKETSSPDEVYIAIKEWISKGVENTDNHILPQFEFVIGQNGQLLKNITIFRTEQLTKELIHYGYKDYKGSRKSSKNYRSYLNTDSISLINRYYKKDFEMFGYPFLNPNQYGVKIALMCRIKNESFIEEFVNYYLAEGVDHIYLIDDMSTLYLDALHRIKNSQRPITISQINLSPNPDHSDKVQIFYEKYIRSKYDWVISVDADEYIATRKNQHATIRKELETTFNKADCIYIPWVMMGFQGREKDPNSLLLETSYRWNHDKRHPVLSESQHSHKYRCRYDSIEYKCIYKPSKFKKWGVHIPTDCNKSTLHLDSVHNDIITPTKKTTYHLSESDITKAPFVCYHYRTTSKEHARRKCVHQNNSQYKEDGQYELLLSNDYNEVNDNTVKDRVLLQNKNEVNKNEVNNNTVNRVGIIITTHGEHGIFARQVLDCCIRTLPSNTYIVLFVNESSEKLTLTIKKDYPQVNYIYVQNQTIGGGLTGTWNKGIDLCVKANCDVVILSNNDVLFDDSITHIVNEARNCPKNKLHAFGPITNGIINTNKQNIMQKGSFATESQPKNLPNKSYLNGFFMVFPIHTLLSNKIKTSFAPLIKKQYPYAIVKNIPQYNEKTNYYFDPRLPFGGNEREWSIRLNAIGGKGIVVPRTYVYHYKFRTWSQGLPPYKPCTFNWSFGPCIRCPAISPFKRGIDNLFLTDSYSLALGSPTNNCLNKRAIPLWINTKNNQYNALLQDVKKNKFKYVPVWYHENNKVQNIQLQKRLQENQLQKRLQENRRQKRLQEDERQKKLLQIRQQRKLFQIRQELKRRYGQQKEPLKWGNMNIVGRKYNSTVINQYKHIPRAQIIGSNTRMGSFIEEKSTV